MAESMHKDCYPGDTCVECGGCDCGAVPSTCVEGCYSLDEHEQWLSDEGIDPSESCYA